MFNTLKKKIKGRPVSFICNRCKAAKDAERQRRRDRKSRIQAACESIANEEPCGESAKMFNNSLRFIFEQQIRIFFIPKFRTVLGRMKALKVIDDAFFEFKDVLSRCNNRLKQILREEYKPQQEKKRTGNAKKQAFDVLGILEDSPPEAIKEAYIEKAKESHPDHGGSLEEMQTVNAAYDLLTKGNGSNGKAESW